MQLFMASAIFDFPSRIPRRSPPSRIGADGSANAGATSSVQINHSGVLLGIHRHVERIRQPGFSSKAVRLVTLEASATIWPLSLIAVA